MLAQVSSTPSIRLSELLALARVKNIEQQMEGLLQYHEKVMQARPVALVEDYLEAIKSRSMRAFRQFTSEKDERPVGAGNDHYHSYRQFSATAVRGMAEEAHEVTERFS